MAAGQGFKPRLMAFPRIVPGLRFERRLIASKATVLPLDDPGMCAPSFYKGGVGWIFILSHLKSYTSPRLYYSKHLSL